MVIYNAVSPTAGSLRWGHSTSVVHNEDKGAMKAKGQARLELPRNPGYASLDWCVCATSCKVHVVRGDGQPPVNRNRHREGASSCFAASLLLCCLVAALHP